MPGSLMAYQVIGLKMASGNVQLQFVHPNGSVAFAAVIPSADFTSLNTTVNGGSTNATLTVPSSTTFYTQDLNRGDYPLGYEGGI